MFNEFENVEQILKIFETNGSAIDSSIGTANR